MHRNRQPNHQEGKPEVVSPNHIADDPKPGKMHSVQPYNYAGGAANNLEEAQERSSSPCAGVSSPTVDTALQVLIMAPLVIVRGPLISTMSAQPGVSGRRESPAKARAAYLGRSRRPWFAASNIFNTSFAGHVKRVLTLAKSIIYTTSDTAKYWFGLT